MPRHMTYMCIYETALCSNEISMFTMLFLANGSLVHKGDTNYIPFKMILKRFICLWMFGTLVGFL